MTVSDLARFLRIPRATINTWLGGRSPLHARADYVEIRLAHLEWSIKERADWYPISDAITHKKRVEYIEGMRDDAERNYRVPKLRAAG